MGYLVFIVLWWFVLYSQILSPKSSEINLLYNKMQHLDLLQTIGKKSPR